jgi:signal transduction histidine kinase
VRLSLRLKLTLFYGLISGLILALGGLVLFVALRESLHQSFDDSLREAAQLAVSQLGGDEGVPRLETEGQRFQASLPGATTLTVYDRQGRPIDRFGTSKVSAPLEPGFATVGEVRIFSKALPEGGFLQATRSQIELGNTLARMGRLVLLALPVLLLIGLGMGYALADRALRPVDQVTRLAGQIAASGRYVERVPTAPGADEMARLTTTVNAMLERLEQTIEHERTFALAAAHELRTPLAVLKGNTSLMLERDRTLEEYRRVVQEVDSTTQELTNTVDSLLALARSRQPRKNLALDLADLALEVSDGLEARARSCGMTFQKTLEPAQMRGDPAGLRLAIGNLLENAIKYGREGGCVWVRSGSSDTGSNDTVTWLEVADDGPGVPDEELERLRQPFQRGAGLQSVPGAGLGLALVTAVIEGHGGTLTLTRAIEGGLRARLEHVIRKT